MPIRARFVLFVVLLLRLWFRLKARSQLVSVECTMVVSTRASTRLQCYEHNLSSRDEMKRIRSSKGDR